MTLNQRLKELSEVERLPPAAASRVAVVRGARGHHRAAPGSPGLGPCSTRDLLFSGCATPVLTHVNSLRLQKLDGFADKSLSFTVSKV